MELFSAQSGKSLAAKLLKLGKGVFKVERKGVLTTFYLNSGAAFTHNPAKKAK
jgi:hypothetical protein